MALYVPLDKWLVYFSFYKQLTPIKPWITFFHQLDTFSKWKIIFYLQVSRLKEPRQLFAITTSTLGPQQQARWPAELEVAIEKLKHSFNSPSVKEPFYIKSKYAAFWSKQSGWVSLLLLFFILFIRRQALIG